MRNQGFFVLLVICGVLVTRSPVTAAEKIYSGKPIRALIVTGGCCHNYTFQAAAMTNGISQQADFEWTVANEGGNGTKAATCAGAGSRTSHWHMR